MKLLFETADGVNLGYPWHQPQLRANYPVLQCAQCSGVVFFTIILSGIAVRMYRVVKDLSEAGCNRPHHGLDA